MAITDDRTTHLSLAKPSAQNLLEDDVSRLRDALDAIDAAIWGRQTAEQVTASVNAAIAAVVDGAPASLNTLNELATALADDANFASTVTTQLAGKADKVHSHTIADVTGLQAALDAKLSSLPIATVSTLGAVKPGSGLSVAADGTLSVSAGSATFQDVNLTVSTNGQTAFTVPGGYTVGVIQLLLNGTELVGSGDDYTASNGTTVTLTTGVSTADTLILRRWNVFNVANTYTKAEVDARTFSAPALVTGTSQLAVSGIPYVLVNAAATSVQFPANPNPSDSVRVYVANGRSDNQMLANGKPILSQADDVALDLGLPCYTWEYIDSTRGWYLQ